MKSPSGKKPDWQHGKDYHLFAIQPVIPYPSGLMVTYGRLCWGEITLRWRAELTFRILQGSFARTLLNRKQAQSCMKDDWLFLSIQMSNWIWKYQRNPSYYPVSVKPFLKNSSAIEEDMELPKTFTDTRRVLSPRLLYFVWRFCWPIFLRDGEEITICSFNARWYDFCHERCISQRTGYEGQNYWRLWTYLFHTCSGRCRV